MLRGDTGFWYGGRYNGWCGEKGDKDGVMVGLERRRCKLLTQFKMIGNDSVCSIWKRMLFLVIVSAFGTQYASQFVRQFNAPSLSSICFSIRASIYVNVSISVYNLLPSHFSFQPTYVFRILNMKEFCFYCKTVQPPILPTPNRPPNRPTERPTAQLNAQPTDRPTNRPKFRFS